jgi:very-short-patch-repair endonuclease
MTEELNKSMYYGAVPSTFRKATLLRNKMTPEETILWERLKGKQICNTRFRRQHPINKFIADFYCHAAKLVVELDGEIHLQQIKYDKERTGILNELGIDVIRFSNSETLKDIDGIIVQIESKVKSRLENNLYP